LNSEDQFVLKSKSNETTVEKIKKIVQEKE